MEFIDLKSQYARYQGDIDSRIKAVLHHGQFINGPEISELEENLAAVAGVSHCITTANGTQSIEIAFRALGIGPGDEVITVPFTWISCAETICLVGARPVFIDIDPDTYNMDAAQLETAITERTKAVLPVSLYGQMSDLETIKAIAVKHDVHVIEDAAQSFGASRNGKMSCSVTEIASTSFFPSKPLGCYGDGGALFTDDEDLAVTMRAIRSHGAVVRHDHKVLGTNSRLDSLQAAVLLAKLPYFQGEIEGRSAVGGRYTELLSEKYITPTVSGGNRHVYAQYTIRSQDRDALKSRLGKQGIPSGIYYPKCLHQQPVFAGLGYNSGDFPHSEKASKEVLSLPMHSYLSPDQQDQIVGCLLEDTIL